MSIARRQNAASRRLDVTSARIVVVVLTMLWLALGCARAVAQDASAGLLVPGNAVVSHFSGANLPLEIPLGADPADTTYIDLNGASLRVLDLQTMGGLPSGQVVDPPRPFVLTAAQIGQAFGVALDNAVPPNIYAAAASVYGLPIVAPSSDPKVPPERLKHGAPNATFMVGLWGPSASGGGPGSIWKIDGKTGAVSLFANVALDGVANSGPALGGIVFDPQSNNLYVADRETGMIHRFGTDGVELGHYDHGTEGRPAQNLPAIPFDASKRLNILDPQFNTEDSATWNYAPPERRIFALGIHAGRLYYAVAAGLNIWSVALNPDGSFGSDATIEFAIPPAAVATEISKITFNEQGRMYLAERAAPTGAYDYGAMMQENAARVMRYSIVDSYQGAPRVWQAEPDEYAIGMRTDYRDTNGGVAIGYDYDSEGVLNRSSCGGFLWSTGELLRNTADPDLSKLLGLSGPLDVDGLQGNSIGLIKPLQAPPKFSYFVDYDGSPPPESERGHVGDIAIWRVCGPELGGAWPSWLDWSFDSVDETLPPPAPPLTCPADQRQPGFTCCPQGSSPDATGRCKPWCPDGAMDAQSQQFCGLGFDPKTYDASDLKKLSCLSGVQPDTSKGYFGCAQDSPVLNAAVCQAGWTKQTIPNVGTFCGPTKEQSQCGPGAQISSIDKLCHRLCLGTAWPSQQCCAPGSVLSSTGRCCPPGSATDPRTGQCQPPTTPTPTTPTPTTPTPTTPTPTTPSTTPTYPCPPGQLGKDNTCCPSGQSPNNVAEGCCPAGTTPNSSGLCRPSACAAPNKMVNDICCSPSDLQTGGKCATGSNSSSTGGAYPNQCKPGQPDCCESGYTKVAGACCLTSQMTSTGTCCPAGQMPSGPDKSQCTPLTTGQTPPPPPPGTGGGGGTAPPQCCLPGTVPSWTGGCCKPELLTRTGICCPEGQSPDALGGLSCGIGPSPTMCHGTMIRGACCPPGQETPAGPNQKCCPAGTHPDPFSRLGCSANTTPGTIAPPPPGPGTEGGTPTAPCPPRYHLSDQRCLLDTGTPPVEKPVEKPSCPAGWTEFPSIGRVPGGWTTDRVTLGGVTIICAKQGATESPKPQPTQKPVPSCDDHEHRSDGTCVCDDGFKHRHGVCVAIEKPQPKPELSCDAHEHPSDGECVCDQGYQHRRGGCVAIEKPQPKPEQPKTCPEGTTGSPPDCQPIAKNCPEGTFGRWPHCRPHWQPKESPKPEESPQPKEIPPPKQTTPCPPGSFGTPPNCHRLYHPHCPEGMTGTPPNDCHPILH